MLVVLNNGRSDIASSFTNAVMKINTAGALIESAKNYQKECSELLERLTVGDEDKSVLENIKTEMGNWIDKFTVQSEELSEAKSALTTIDDRMDSCEDAIEDFLTAVESGEDISDENLLLDVKSISNNGIDIKNDLDDALNNCREHLVRCTIQMQDFDKYRLNMAVVLTDIRNNKFKF